jgi:hypothetical protein
VNRQELEPGKPVRVFYLVTHGLFVPHFNEQTLWKVCFLRLTPNAYAQMYLEGLVPITHPTEYLQRGLNCIELKTFTLNFVSVRGARPAYREVRPLIMKEKGVHLATLDKEGTVLKSI